MLRKLRAKDEESDKDRYLITYADLITLLLGLFVILYASAQVDSSKFKDFQNAFNKIFSSKNGVLEGSDGILEGARSPLLNPLAESGDVPTLDDLLNQMKRVLDGFEKSGGISVSKVEDGLIVNLSESLLFEKARAEIKQGGEEALDSLASILNRSDNPIMVDGHTDSDPIRTYTFESNWHLSVARATNVAYKLIVKGVPGNNLVIRGYGSERPIASNESEEGKSMNRRVEIKIMQITPEVPTKSGYAD